MVWFRVLCFLLLGFAFKVEAASCAPPTQATTTETPGHPFSALPSADGCWLFVSVEQAKHGAVVVMKNHDGLFVVDHVVALPHYAFGEALSPDGRVLVATGGESTSVLSVAKLEQGASDAVLGELSGGAGAGAVYAAIAPDNRHVFISDEHKARIDVFDLGQHKTAGSAAGQLVGSVPVAYSPVGLAFSPDGKWLYATNQRGPASMPASCATEQGGIHRHPAGLLLRIDVAKAISDPRHSLIAALRAGCNPVRVAVSPDGSQLWVSARGGDALLDIDAHDWLAGNKQPKTMSYAIGTSPVGVAVRPDDKQVWVALSARFNQDSNGKIVGLTGFNKSTPLKQLAATTPGFPRELAFLSDGHTLVATLYDANKVVLLQTP
jgi:DNA-binding beta-propeller fold protein YncE